MEGGSTGAIAGEGGGGAGAVGSEGDGGAGAVGRVSLFPKVRVL